MENTMDENVEGVKMQWSASPAITVKKDAEFFVSICKERGGLTENHAFFVLGVVDNEGNPRRLLSVGKRWDVEPLIIADDVDAANLKMITGEKILSALLEEMSRHEGTNKVKNVTATSYSITFQQFNGFLDLIEDIESKQDDIEEIKCGKKSEGVEKIKGYVPLQSEADETSITLVRGALPKHHASHAQALAEEASYISRSNTCRTSALSIITAGLGFAPNVSPWFFRSAGYPTTFKGGNPDKDTFYILPPPPTSYSNYQEFNDKQKIILELIYQQLEEIPKTNPGDSKTQDKFSALKKLYCELAGKNKANAEELIVAIELWENKDKNKEIISAHRNPEWYRNLFKETATQKTLTKIKQTLAANARKGFSERFIQWIKTIFQTTTPAEDKLAREIKETSQLGKNSEKIESGKKGESPR